MNVPEDLKYAESHEWVRTSEGDIVTVGISDYAQKEMTELVYVELPDVGRSVTAGEEIAVVESVKSASDIYSPVSGEVVEVNESLVENPAVVNESPFEDGWLYRLKINDASELDNLLTPEAYKSSIS